MTDFKSRRVQAAERREERRRYLEAEARRRGAKDVDGYVRAVMEGEDGVEIDDMPGGRPEGQP